MTVQKTKLEPFLYILWDHNMNRYDETNKINKNHNFGDTGYEFQQHEHKDNDALSKI